MGVMGAALASLVSRAIACVAVLYLLQRPACPLRVDAMVSAFLSGSSVPQFIL